MKTDDLNEWEIRIEDDDVQQMLSTSIERRGGQIIFQFPEPRPSIDSQFSRALSPAKSNRDSSQIQRWSLLSREELYTRRARASNDNLRNMQVCGDCTDNGAQTSRSKVRKASSNPSPTHLNQLILRLQDQTSSLQSRPSKTSSTRIRIHKPVFNYESLKIKLDDPEEVRLNYCSSLPSTKRHSKKYRQLYHEAVKKELIRREALKKIPRKRRKKIIAHVSPQPPRVQEAGKIQCKPEALKKNRKMLNFRIDEKRSLSHQPQLINGDLLMEIIRLRRQVKLGILTRN